MTRLMLILCALLLGAPALAADDLEVGATPPWVVAVSAPVAVGDSGAIVPRLFDFQTRLDDDGVHQYAHQVMRVTAPEGLQAAGNVIVAWQPATDRLTMHRVAIRRGGAVIDVLKDGKGFTTIRRESGLEASMLDGRLSAIMQVPDLRVGDEVEIAYTLHSRNPVLAGHVETDNFFVGGVTIDRLHVRASWPTARGLRWRAGEALPKPVVKTAGGETVLLIDRTAFTLPMLPERAPGRYADTARLQLSDFASWQALSTLMAPLYDSAATLASGSPLAAEIARIAAASTDPKARATAALALVQSQVRYLARLNGLGGYTPTSADAVWAERSGDCKGKTALLLALLRGLGIAAEPVLVSVRQGDGVDRSLPMAGRFDHVLVRAVVAGRTYWLDGTRSGDRDLDRIPVPGFEWALPMMRSGAELVAMTATEPTSPSNEWRLDLDAREGVSVPAKATGEGIFRGEAAAGFRMAMSFLSASAREEELKKMWRERHDWIEVETVSYRADDATGEVRLGFTGKAPMDWETTGAEARNRYEANKARLGQNVTPQRKPGPGSDAPVQIDEQYSVTRQTILLPNDGRGFFVEGEQIDEKAAGMHYLRTASIKGGRFEMMATTRGKANEITLAEAKAADKISDATFAKQLFVRMPYDYQATKGELAQKGTVADSPEARLAALQPILQKGDFKGALPAIDAIIKKDGRSAQILTMRSFVLRALDRTADADADLDAALALDPSNLAALDGKASVLAQAGHFDDALILLDRIVLLQPGEPRAYIGRASMRAMAGKSEAALSDLAIALEKQPDNSDARIQRVTLLNRVGQRDRALADADEYVKLLPEDETAHALRGNILAMLDRKEEASTALARSLALRPTADAYVTRLTYGLSGDARGQLADVLAAIRLDPRRPFLTTRQKSLLADPTAYAAILSAYDVALKAAPRDEGIIVAREWAEAAAGHHEKALARMDKAVAAAPGLAGLRNNVCWYRATNNVEIDKALVDCDKAIELQRNAAFFDSRGLVGIRRGEYARAISDYDAALTLRPDSAGSLFARGLAKLKSGDPAGGRADLAGARKLQKTIDETFASYGLKAE